MPAPFGPFGIPAGVHIQTIPATNIGKLLQQSVTATFKKLHGHGTNSFMVFKYASGQANLTLSVVSSDLLLPSHFIFVVPCLKKLTPCTAFSCFVKTVVARLRIFMSMNLYWQ